MLGQSGPLAVALIVAMDPPHLRVVLLLQWSSPSCFPLSTSSSSSPNPSSRTPTPNSSSSYGLFSLESTYILITIKLQVIKLLRECTLSDFDIINNYLHITLKVILNVSDLWSTFYLAFNPAKPATKSRFSLEQIPITSKGLASQVGLQTTSIYISLVMHLYMYIQLCIYTCAYKYPLFRSY